jgi:hypothetical protein
MAEAKLLAASAPTRSRWKNPFAALRLTPALQFALVTVLVLGIVFTSGTLTVAAAQNSLPAETLYPLKTWSEDLRLSLAQDAAAQVALDLEFANRRVDELQTMLQSDEIPPESVVARLETQVDHALQIASSLPDERATPALLQISGQLRACDQTLRQVHLRANAPAAAIQAQAQAVLQRNAQYAETGATQPGWLRKQFQQRGQPTQPSPMPSATPFSITDTPTSGAGLGIGQSRTPHPNGSMTPGNGNGNGAGGPQGPSVTGTPMPGNGNGPGQPQSTVKPQNTPASPGGAKKTPSDPDSGGGGGGGSGGGGGGGGKP